jgi:hypothetical protein
VSGTFIRLIAVALALLLPLQGMASVIAAQCMTSAHHQDAAAHDHEDAHHGEHDNQAGSLCGPCMACCASASIAAPVRPLVLPAAHADYVFRQLSPLAIEPQRLDRPPLAG